MLINTATTLFIKEHLNDDPIKLALQGNKYPEVDLPAAINQIVGNKIVSEKIPSWTKIDGLIFPSHLPLEQCSSELTAKYKASLMNGTSFVDLTAGFGIDCAFIAKKFTQGTYIERQKELCDIATNNFPLLNLNHIDIINLDGLQYLKNMEEVDWIFLDPARRNKQGKKTVAIEDCEPDVSVLWELMLQKASKVMIKLSPMLDISLALKSLSFVSEVHIISTANECKELLIILDRKAVNKEIQLHCINLLKENEIQHFSFSKEDESHECQYTEEVGIYLYEPNASILKAGAYKCIANRFGLKKLHPNSHLYTSNNFIKQFPGRKFHCESVFGLNKRELKSNLADIKKANITIRNFPSSVDELRKRTKLNDGGELFLFATTLYNEQKALIKCTKAI